MIKSRNYKVAFEKILNLIMQRLMNYTQQEDKLFDINNEGGGFF